MATIVEGNGQVAFEAERTAPLRVKVTERESGRAVEGIIVTFEVENGRAMEIFSASDINTNSDEDDDDDDDDSEDSDFDLITTSIFNRMTNASGIASLESLVPAQSGLLTLAVSIPGTSFDQVVFQIAVHPSDISYRSSVMFSPINEPFPSFDRPRLRSSSLFFLLLFCPLRWALMKTDASRDSGRL